MKRDTPITVDVFGLLLDVAKSQLIPTRYQSIAELVDIENKSFMLSPQPLPYNPYRLATSKKQQKLCDELFPRKRTVVWVNKKHFFEYKSVVEKQSLHQYGVNNKESTTISNRYSIEVLIWFGLKKNDILLDTPYFSDKELLELVNIDKVVTKSIMDVYVTLGHSPSAREYETIRKSIGGPSLSFIKSAYGSFNKAKANLELELWEWKGKKYI